MPDGVKRGAAPEFDVSARFTTMLGGTAAGNMLPAFNIIKCTVDRADLRSTTVIQALHKHAGYTAADGWALHIWERDLALKIKGVMTTTRYFRPYLVHVDGMVITTQHKAWMDSVGMCMWVDLVMGPWAKASGRKKILVWDSCGPHKVAAVKAVFDQWCVPTTFPASCPHAHESSWLSSFSYHPFHSQPAAGALPSRPFL